jgi:hypothetical protein
VKKKNKKDSKTIGFPCAELVSISHYPYNRFNNIKTWGSLMPSLLVYKGQFLKVLKKISTLNGTCFSTY